MIELTQQEYDALELDSVKLAAVYEWFQQQDGNPELQALEEILT